MRRIFAWIHSHERHVSALAMIAGFVADNIFFERVDLWQTQALLAGYACACLIAIPALHYFETRATKRGAQNPRLRLTFQLVIQFALGGFWSAFVIFYGRSAVFGASWPFLLFLLLIFLGSEYFHRYHARLVFTSVLFFFALYAWAIFEVPLFTGSIGTGTFLLSGGVAIGLFALFTALLRYVAHERFVHDVWRIRVGALAVLVMLNVFYFFGMLPALPLSVTASGVYHEVTHVPGNYFGTSESYPWTVRYLDFPPTLRLRPGSALSAYSAIYAPVNLSTTIVHRWQWYNDLTKTWVTRSVVSYAILGGRENGYRGYTTAPISSPGVWRVSIETFDGRLLDRLGFTVVFVDTVPSLTTLTLP